jgi:large subunit ribosomal protein L5
VADQENNPQGKNQQGKGQQKGNQGNRPARPEQNTEAKPQEQSASTNGRSNGKSGGAARENYVPRLKNQYINEVVPALTKEFNYTNPMQVPHVQKVVINIGMGSEARENAKSLDNAVGDVGQITGQKAVITRAKKSIASFKLRTGMPIGVMVTLRGNRMYDFLDKLFNISLARVRDFSGVNPKSFDGHGNYSLGLKEQLIFPEIDYDKIDRIRGMEIVIVTSANNDEEGRALLQGLGMPFRRQQQQ